VITWLSLLSLGCFQPIEELSTIDTRTVPYESPHLTAEDVLIHRFESTLTCPDGNPAEFFIVAAEGATAESPVAIVLHSGAFDFVIERSDGEPLSGPHYHAQSRLEADFGVAKVYETLGLQVTDLDPAEENEGTLPAALANQGMVQFIPANCWGDLWHNEEGIQYNDIETDGFPRNGLTFAWWMVRIATDPDFAAGQGVDLDIAWDPESLYLLGLGEGGRGVVELLAHGDMPAVSGALIDSSPDDLSAYLRSPSIFGDEIEGISRIFAGEALDRVSDWSIAALADTLALPPHLVYLWSDGNTRLPMDATSEGASALIGRPGSWVVNTHEPVHVISNSDLTRAREVVDFLQTGIKPVTDQ
jgi:hypothetical protein